MRGLFQRQLAKATKGSGHVDLDLLANLVTAAYVEADRDRQRTDRSISLMADELQRAHASLLEAFNVVPEGLVLLDSEGKYVLFNDKFLELHDTAADKIAIGASFADSVRAGIERGHYLDAIGREAEWLAERLSHKQDAFSSEQHIRGDRWLRVDERRTADGGSIGVRIDITELKRREKALKIRSDQLVEAQRLGKTGDWTYMLSAVDLWLSPQIIELLGYDQTQTMVNRDAVLALYTGDGAARVLAAHAEVIRSGKAKSVDVKFRRGDGTIADIVVAINTMTDAEGRVIGFCGTMQDISDRKIAEEKLEKLAYFDPLTGLANRALFHREIDDVLGRCIRSGSPAALLLLDLDRFKEVNDSLGHISGDELLAKVAQRISRLLGGGHFFSRLGGDEFAIVLQDCADRVTIENLCAGISAAISGSIELDRGEVTIGTSIGVAMIPADGRNLIDLQRNADLALYRAKENGRGRTVFFEPDMSALVQHKLTLARDLRRALTDDLGLAVHYQPQVSLGASPGDRRVAGFEALMRWRHPTLGHISPAEFIPLAESSQLISDLGLWILRRATAQAKTWLDAGEPAREIAVNVSSAQIWHTDFARDVAQVLEESGLPPHLLCLELTESLLADYAGGRTRDVLTKLKSLGVSLALDDFGTDYSSLGYLTQLPFDKIKIDRIFVDGITESKRSRNLLEGIIALGRGLGLTIVAEGAEKAEELAILDQLRCDIVQGYVFARPTLADNALTFARSMEGDEHDGNKHETNKNSVDNRKIGGSGDFALATKKPSVAA